MSERTGINTHKKRAAGQVTRSERKRERKRQLKEGDESKSKTEDGASAFLQVLGFTGNILSSISCIILNKMIFETAGSKCPGTLAALHVFSSWLFSDFCARSGVFVPKEGVPMKPLIVLGLIKSSSLLVLNLSLNFNTVGVFQVTKLSCIPASVLVEKLVQDKQHSAALLSSLCILLTGVSIVVVSDVNFNAVGVIFGVFMIVTTLLDQNGTAMICKQYGMSTLQLVHKVFLPDAIIMLFVGLLSDILVDALPSITVRSGLLMLASAVAAFFVNLTTTFILRVSSPLTYQVLGQTKTVLTLVSGHLIFWTLPTSTNVLGYGCAILGACWYAHCRSKS